MLLHKAKFHSKIGINKTDKLTAESTEDDDKLYYSLISGEIDPELIVKVESKEQTVVKKLGIQGTKIKLVFTDVAHRLCLAGFVLDILG